MSVLQELSDEEQEVGIEESDDTDEEENISFGDHGRDSDEASDGDMEEPTNAEDCDTDGENNFFLEKLINLASGKKNFFLRCYKDQAQKHYEITHRDKTLNKKYT